MIPKSILKPFVPSPLNIDHLEFHQKHTYGDIITEEEASAVIDKNPLKINLRISVLVKINDFYVFGFMAKHGSAGTGGVQYHEEHFINNICEHFEYAHIYPLAKTNEISNSKILGIFTDHFPDIKQHNDNCDRASAKKDKKNVQWNLQRNEVLSIPRRICPQRPAYEADEEDAYCIFDDDTIEDLDEDATYDDPLEETFSLPESPEVLPPEALDDLTLVPPSSLYDRYIQLVITYSYEIREAAVLNAEMAALYEAAIEQCISELKRRKLPYISFINTREGTP